MTKEGELDTELFLHWEVTSPGACSAVAGITCQNVAGIYCNNILYKLIVEYKYTYKIRAVSIINTNICKSVFLKKIGIGMLFTWKSI